MSSLYDLIEKIDVGNLLNEDLERSRNSFLFVCFVTTVLTLVKVEQVQAFGARFSIENHGGLLVFSFLFSASVLMAVYYLVNAHSGILDKKARLQMLKAGLSNAKDNVNGIKQANLIAEKNTKEGVADVPLEEIQTLKTEIESAEKFTENFERQFNRQKSVSQALPYCFVLIGLSSEIIAIYFEIVYF